MSKKLLALNIFAVLLMVGLIGGFFYYRTKAIGNCESILSSYKENHLCILTNKGAMAFELYPDAAPKSVSRIKKLANQDKFYDGLEFYQVTKDFVVQGGVRQFIVENARVTKFSPADEAKSKIFEERLETEVNFEKLGLTKEEREALEKEKFVSNSSLNSRKFEYGSLAFAHSDTDPDTNSTEIFIITLKDPNSDDMKSINGRFTNMGKIVKGQDVLDKLNNSEVVSQNDYKPVDRISIIEMRGK